MLKRVKSNIDTSFQIYLELIITGFFEAVYIGATTLLNLAFDRLIAWASPTGFNYWVLTILQIIFTLSSSIICVIHVFEDLRAAYLRARFRISSLENVRSVD